MMVIDRRDFIKAAATTAALLPFQGALASGDTTIKGCDYPIFFFTKLLDPYEPDFMAETLAMAGIRGFDLTVRPGGRVEPERVSDDLPKIIETGKKYNISTGMMVTAIQDATDPFAEEVLSVASSNGIKHYRLGYYDYDFRKGVWESLAEIKQKIQRLALLNEKLGIQGGYQNHSGTRVGAPLWDIWELIRDLPPQWMSSQFDVRHASVEGAHSWIVDMNLLKGHIGSLAIKDYQWEATRGKPKDLHVPLGEGFVDFDLYFKTLRELKILAPITLHIEYPLLNRDQERLSLLKQQEIMVLIIKKDLDFVQEKLIEYQILEDE